MYNRGDFEKAREFYREALQNDSSCVEALYNFGTVILSVCHHGRLSLDINYKLICMQSTKLSLFKLKRHVAVLLT